MTDERQELLELLFATNNLTLTLPMQEAPVCTGGRGLGSQETEAEERPGEGRGTPGPGDAQHGRGEGDPPGGE